MSDRVSPTRPVTHRRRRQHRPPIDHYVLEQVRAAVAAPLVLILSVLGGVVIVWQTAHVPTGPLLTALAGGLLAAAGLGAVRARAASFALERAHEAQLQRVTEAVSAVEKLVVWTAEELCRGATPPIPESLPPLEDAGPADEAVALLSEVQVQAVAALIRVRDESKSAVLLSMQHQFSKREHALIDRALAMLDRLQDLTEDPDQLDTLYKLDHLVTRMRRWVESKAVVAGQSLRSAREPVNVVQVLRGANQEIMHYSRVNVAAATVGVELGLPRHVGPDLTHLLAELVENATQFSDPATKVQVRAQQVARGLAIEVEDRVAIPMRPNDRERWNRLLADPDRIDVSAEVSAGRLGLLTAALIARNYGISVELKENSTGGTTALVVVPNRLLVAIAAPVDAAAFPMVPVAPPQATLSQAAGAARSGGGQSAPPDVRSVSAPGAGQAAGAPRLPQRVVGESPQRPSRPRPSATAPRFGLAGAFQQNFKAASAQDRSSPAARPDASGPPVPPSVHP
ncbi:sensor histidine kinase KdpD [Streptomyces sp. TRM68367]|uniref:sensor histidine kinase n=1 Tax=Streptomyces sp. TRM68367 TaxID=2758415 RepID=UPI00165B559F|nr:sensor histidine kinase [Streptomyces sp. TRM68367]MBC9724976.1 sensor histidine kinase [Streptomyces sp. TRM68367]